MLLGLQNITGISPLCEDFRCSNVFNSSGQFACFKEMNDEKTFPQKSGGDHRSGCFIGFGCMRRRL
jgi:hypothetical protein